MKDGFKDDSNVREPTFGAETFSCPHCSAVAHHDWYSLFLKPENANQVDVLTPETVTVRTLVQGMGEWNDIKEADQFVERLKKNEVTYIYQKHSQAVKVQDGEPARQQLSQLQWLRAVGEWPPGVSLECLPRLAYISPGTLH